MKYFLLIGLIYLGSNHSVTTKYPDGDIVLNQIDKNLHINKAISNVSMIINGRNGSREIKSKIWINGTEKAFVEYTYPPREKGKKMLKRDNKMWVYFPEPTDRVITISGHLLKQPVMGSDLSYEDLTDNMKLIDQYEAKVTGIEKVGNKNCYVVDLTAKTDNIAYYKRRIWVDQQIWLPLKEEKFAKSGKPLKRSELLEVIRVDNRWYPKRILHCDLLQNGNGTEYIIESIELNPVINEAQFTKAALKK